MNVLVEAVGILAEDGGVDSEGGSVGRVTPATSVEGPDTGPSTARDEVTQSDAHSRIKDCRILLVAKKLMRQTEISISKTSTTVAVVTFPEIH